MRYLSEILKRLGCNYDWFTFWVGRSLDLIETSEVTQYAEKYIVDKPQEKNPLIIELAWNNEPQIVDDNLQKLVIEIYGQSLNKESSEWIEEERKWRYCILKKLRMNIKNYEQLLERVAKVYSDMDYPKEMESFIYYIPSSDGYDPRGYSKEQNQKRLVQMLDMFLKKEHDMVVGTNVK